MNIDLAQNWSRLTAITTDMVVQNFGTKDDGSLHTIMLNDLRQDRVVGDITVLGMYRAPASKDRHHDREGGLVQHLLEMWDIWMTDGSAIIRQWGKPHPLINDGLIWRTILYHDLNKVWRYRLESQDPWKVDFAKDEDKLAKLIGNHNKALWFLHKYGIKLSLPLFNALLCSEGGYNKHSPEVETVLAKTVYLLDELSANVADRLNYNRFWDSKSGGISENGE